MSTQQTNSENKPKPQEDLLGIFIKWFFFGWLFDCFFGEFFDIK